MIFAIDLSIGNASPAWDLLLMAQQRAETEELQAMGRLSTHVLDTVHGKPAEGVRIELHRLRTDGAWQPIATTVTNADGRTDAPLLIGDAYKPGTYQLAFHIGDYFRARGAKLSDPAFLDVVPLRFSCTEADGHYHVPLLASPWSYSTYRGS